MLVLAGQILRYIAVSTDTNNNGRTIPNEGDSVQELEAKYLDTLDEFSNMNLILLRLAIVVTTIRTALC